MKMLVAVTTALIVAPLLVLGFAYEDYYPQICNDEMLTLQNIQSDILSRNVISSPSLRCLSILRSSISSLERGVFDELPNLTYLNLDGNSISPNNLFSFGKTPNVRALILSNQEYCCNEALQLHTAYPKLRYLNLKNTMISDIQSNTDNPFPNLTHLDVSSNRLTSIDWMEMWNNTLQHLNLDDNNLSGVYLGELNNLISLTLANNNIPSISENGLSLSGLRSLEHLSLWNNRISYIDEDAFKDTVNLRYLNMSRNSLKVLSPGIFAPLTSLEVLLLDNNELEELPLMIPLNTTILSMNCNNIKYLTANSLLMLSNLKNLSLSGNKISSVYVDSTNSQISLEELYLNDNHLSHLPAQWQSFMKNLRLLDLAGNNITSIKSVLGETEMALEHLHLEDNPLGSFNTNLFEAMTKNVTIYLNFGAVRSKPNCNSNSKQLDYY